MAAPHERDQASRSATSRAEPGSTGETDRARLNRTFAELLQEIRVAETGVQILFAFLLTLPFTARFERMDGLDICAYAVATLGSAVATVALVAPVSYHRLAFRAGRKPEIVSAVSVLAQAGLVAFGVALVSAGFLIADVVLGLRWGIGFAALLVCLEASLWYVLPLTNLGARRRPGRNR